jgi:hypothetical protein
MKKMRSKIYEWWIRSSTGFSVTRRRSLESILSAVTRVSFLGFTMLKMKFITFTVLYRFEISLVSTVSVSF